jgi:hypothetical protein
MDFKDIPATFDRMFSGISFMEMLLKGINTLTFFVTLFGILIWTYGFSMETLVGSGEFLSIAIPDTGYDDIDLHISYGVSFMLMGFTLIASGTEFRQDMQTFEKAISVFSRIIIWATVGIFMNIQAATMYECGLRELVEDFMLESVIGLYASLLIPYMILTAMWILFDPVLKKKAKAIGK